MRNRKKGMKPGRAEFPELGHLSPGKGGSWGPSYIDSVAGLPDRFPYKPGKNKGRKQKIKQAIRPR
jgi:hypothetical protein